MGRLISQGFLGAKAPLQLRFCQKKQRFSLQRHKSSRIRHSPNSGTVRRFSPWNVFPLMEPAVRGFGLRLLISQGFLGAKAGHSDQRFGCLCNQVLPKTLRFSLQRHKTPEFGEAEFWDSMSVFLWRDLAGFCKVGLSLFTITIMFCSHL